MNRFVLLLSTVIVALTITAAPALAQTSGSGYSTPAGEVQADVSNSPSDTSNNNSGPTNSTATKTASGSQLPFTGLDVGLLLGAGLGLLLVGGALSRLTRSAASRTE